MAERLVETADEAQLIDLLPKEAGEFRAELREIMAQAQEFERDTLANWPVQAEGEK